MQPDDWQSCTEIFDSVVEQPPDERASILNQRCAGNDALRLKVELLLKYHDQSGDFIEVPAFEAAPELLLDDVDALVGTHFGRYRIDSVLGRGGMGVVYLGIDEQLGRKVGLKLLPDSLVANTTQLENLKREARTASALNHPNIVTIHEIGEADGIHYIATEFIEGTTLRNRLTSGPVPAKEIVEIAKQIASALSVAHAAGIVHRDIKPENIMIRPDGYVKVLDFGIARTVAGGKNDVDLVGTPSFASPEQFEARAFDPRSDIYSLGATLWFALTGSPPFVGRSVDQIRTNQRDGMLPVQHLIDRKVPAPFVRLLSSMLAFAPEKRPASAGEILQRLQGCQPNAINRGMIAGLATAAAAAIVLIGTVAWQFTRHVPNGIAVLPFDNLTQDQANAYFAEGIQDEILTRLSKIADLKVISRTSTENYKSRPRNLREIAKELGVGNILEGSVQKRGDAVRVNVQLINAINDAHLWADTFDRNLDDIFSIESDVARTVADQLRAKLTGQEEKAIAARPTKVPEAYDAYLRGLAYSLKMIYSPANALGAQKYLKESVRLDPKFAPSWALLSYVDSRGYLTRNLQPTPRLRDEAGQAAATALGIQPNLGEAILAKGYYHYACLKDYNTAVQYYQQARKFLPNTSRIPESLAFVARRQGRWDQSESWFNEAERLDPRNVYLLTQHAQSYIMLRRFPEARRKLDQVLNITPDDPDVLAIMAAVAQAEGDLQRASTLLAQIRWSTDDPSVLETQIYQAILDGRAAATVPRLKEMLVKTDPALGYYTGELRFWLGWLEEICGDHAVAHQTWQQAHDELETFFKEQPDNNAVIEDLALTDMFLGEKAEASKLAEQAMAAIPIDKDAMAGPRQMELLARVMAQTGDHDRAITALSKLLGMPYSGLVVQSVPLTPAFLRLDPMFDPLRNDARFQRLVASAK